MSNWRAERCECRAIIPEGMGVLQTVVGQTAIYVCRPCALRYLKQGVAEPAKDEAEKKTPSAGDDARKGEPQ